MNFLSKGDPIPLGISLSWRKWLSGILFIQLTRGYCQSAGLPKHRPKMSIIPAFCFRLPYPKATYIFIIYNFFLRNIIRYLFFNALSSKEQTFCSLITGSRQLSCWNISNEGGMNSQRQTSVIISQRSSQKNFNSFFNKKKRPAKAALLR